MADTLLSVVSSTVAPGVGSNPLRSQIFWAGVALPTGSLEPGQRPFGIASRSIDVADLVGHAVTPIAFRRGQRAIGLGTTPQLVQCQSDTHIAIPGLILFKLLQRQLRLL